MMRSFWKGTGAVVLAGLLTIPAWANSNVNVNTSSARPGTLNYIEGQATLGSQPVDSHAVGSASLDQGQVLATQSGKAELLLTPGIFLRVDSNSAVRMDSAGLANTELTVDRGRVLVEVNDIRKENDVVIRSNGVETRLLNKGLYEFDANAGTVRVFEGKAEVLENGRHRDVGGGHMLAFNDPKMKSQGFDKKGSEDEFYRWAKLRSSYLAEANIDAARTYYAGGPGWYGAGWYWDPWFASYTWLPGDGMFWSPFGWGFYSPFAVYSAPLFWGGGYYHHFGPGYRAPVVAARPGIGARGFAGGMRTGGGFHGFAGGGGYHGFAGGGGFHGGGGRR